MTIRFHKGAKSDFDTAIMLKKSLFLLLVLFTALHATPLKLTDAQANQTARKIWLNEGSGKRDKLVW